jgi:uncharacterized protein
MSKSVVRVEVKAVVPANGGCAIFLGNATKSFVIYIDHYIGSAITMAMRQLPRERPQTHDLMMSMLKGFGAKVDRVVINDAHQGVFYARLILSMENELYQRKLLEIDARPSDSIALAVQSQAPIFVSEAVWEEVEDMSEMLQKVQSNPSPDSPTSPHESDDDIPF